MAAREGGELMKLHTKKGGKICFQQYVGDGNYGETEFTLCVSMRPDGALLGMPVINFKDDEHTTVVFELEDILPMAYEFAYRGKAVKR